MPTSCITSRSIMNAALEDELLSIRSIYDDSTFTRSSAAADTNICILRLPSRPAVGVHLAFPSNYPDAPPSAIATEAIEHDVSTKGESKKLLELIRDVLASACRPGEPCVFDLIQEAESTLQTWKEAQSKDDEPRSGLGAVADADVTDGPAPLLAPLSVQPSPPWIASDVTIEKKSVFVARVAHVTSAAQAKSFLAHLLATDRKVAKATHNITAWRIRVGGGAAGAIVQQDCDDDGETAAGGRVLHLLQIVDVWDLMVVVTRWYGGVRLGPDRFRIIGNVARDALSKGGYLKEAVRSAAGKAKGSRGLQR